MRSLLLLALCGLALANVFEQYESYEPVYETINARDIRDTSFKPGREYKYFYDGQIMNGIPRSSHQHAGTRIQALITLQMPTANKVVLKLNNIRFGKLNTKVFNPRAELPFRLFEPVELQPEHKSQLELPVEFSYVDGMIREVRFESKEEPWSANVKRGVLNLLQVNVRQHGATDASDDMKMTNSVTRGLGHAKFFKVMEKTLEGECETAYSVAVIPKPSNPQAPVLNITKAINFERCNRRPHIKYNWRFSDSCPSCDPKYQDNERFLKSSSIVKYNMTGTRESFMIESAKAESQYSLMFYSEEGSYMNTYVNQTLRLFKTAPISSKITVSSPLEAESNLIYSLDWDSWKEKFFLESDTMFRERSPYSKVENKVEMAKVILDQMARYVHAEEDRPVSVEAPRIFMRLVTVLRMCTTPEIEELHKIYFTDSASKEVKLARDVLPNALALAGTEPCLKHLILKIKSRQISKVQSMLALKQLPLMRVASQKTVNEIKALCESEVVESYWPLKKTCYLSLGSVIMTACQPKQDKLAIEQKSASQHTTKCSMAQKQDFVKLLIKKFKSAERWENKIVYLKALSNAGLDVAVFELEKIIQNEDTYYPPYVRNEAILALRQMRNLMPVKVQKVLMPLIMNPREPARVRIPAAYMVISSLPEKPVLEMIAKQMNTDPSVQTASFVHSYMKSLANSTQPCYKRLAHDCKLALRLMRQVPSGLMYSKYLHVPMQSWYRKVGIDIEPFSVLSSETFLPKTLGFNLNTNLMGFFNKDILSASLTTAGLEPSLSKIFSPEGHYYTRKLSEILVRGKRSAQSYRQHLTDIFQSLKVSPRTWAQKDTPPLAFASYRWLGHEMGMLPFSPDYISSLFEEGKLPVSALESSLREGYNFRYNYATNLAESQLKIPTTIGFPLVIRNKVPAILKVSGRVQATIEPTSAIHNVLLTASVKPSLAISAVQKMEVWNPIANAGVKVHSNARVFLPIEAKLEANLKSTPVEIKLTMEPPTTERELITLETQPITYTRSWPSTLKVFEHPEEKVVYGEQINRVQKIRTEWPGKMFGIGFVAYARYTPMNWNAPRYVPICPLSGPNRLSIFAKPGPERPEKIEIKLVAGPGTPSGSLSPEGLKPSLFKDFESSEDLSSEEHETSYSSPILGASDILLEIKTKGGATPRRAALEFGHKCTAGRRLCKIFGKAVRSPIPEYDSSPYEVCWNGEVLYPQVPFTPAELHKKKMASHVDIKFGPTCGQSKISISAESERSERELPYERSQEEEYHRCQKYGSESPIECYEYLRKAARPTKFHINIAYENIPVPLKNATVKTFRSLLNRYYSQSDLATIDVKNPPNRIRATIRVDPYDRRRVNVTVKAPGLNATVTDGYLPFKLTPVNLKAPAVPRFLEYISGAESSRPKCDVSSRRIRTFDGQRYSVPLTDCYSVLAKDCSNSNRFAVLMKKMSPNSPEKKLKILTHNHELILTKEGSEIMIKKDGSSYTPEEPVTVRAAGEQVAKCFKTGPYVKCVLPLEGVSVYFDGITCSIKISPAYLGQQCGLCGHYDLEPSKEFYSPENEPMDDVRSFFLKYIVKSSDCSVPSEMESMCSEPSCPYRPHYVDQMSSSESVYDAPRRVHNPKTIEPKRLNKIVKKIGKTCFSKKPIAMCPEYAYPAEGSMQDVEFACLPSKEFKTNEMSYTAQFSPVPEVLQLPTTFSKPVMVPTICKKY